jgi:hypothetical protein
MKMVLEFESPRFAGDPLLAEILNDPDTGTRKLQAGSPADTVRILQEALFDLTWNRKTSQPLILERSEFVVGIYGPKTTEAVKAFKTRYGIRFPPSDPAGFIDGLAGPRTLAQLDRVCVVLDASIAAIEAKAQQLIASGIDVTITPSELRTLPIDNTSGTFTPAHIAGASGAIFFTRGHGEANEVHGNIYDAYLPSFAGGPFGFPITDEEDIDDQPGFRASHFENGRMRCELATGVVDQLLSQSVPPEADPVF